MSIFSLFGARAEKPRADFAISDKEVIARGWTEPELKQIIGDFVQMYRERVPASFSTAVHSNGDVVRVTFPADIEPRFFCWLINYIQYPKGLDFRARSILVVGKATITSDFLPSEQSLIGKRMTVYIPADDKEYDVVFGRVDGQSYEFPFASERWRRMQNPRLPREIDNL
jgi:hypothetical protein